VGLGILLCYLWMLPASQAPAAVGQEGEENSQVSNILQTIVNIWFYNEDEEASDDDSKVRSKLLYPLEAPGNKSAEEIEEERNETIRMMPSQKKGKNKNDDEDVKDDESNDDRMEGQGKRGKLGHRSYHKKARERDDKKKLPSSTAPEIKSGGQGGAGEGVDDNEGGK
jgi:hypothetical protein